MQHSTKDELEKALKALLLKKPLDKITITDLTNHCGISRMAFYYHFKDIYDLVEWACLEDAKKALNNRKTKETWQEGFLDIFEVVYENKPFIMNAYHVIKREQIENFLYACTFDLLLNVVEQQSQDKYITTENKIFIAQFYKYGFVGLMLDWIKNGMRDDYHLIVEKLAKMMDGTFDAAIKKLSF